MLLRMELRGLIVYAVLSFESWGMGPLLFIPFSLNLLLPSLVLRNLGCLQLGGEGVGCAEAQWVKCFWVENGPGTVATSETFVY